MTDADYERLIAANRNRAAISRAHNDIISGDYWDEQADALEAEREASRDVSAAEQTVARLDSYTQEQHAAGIDAARERMLTRRTRRARAAEAASRLRDHCVTFDVLKGSPDHSRVPS